MLPGQARTFRPVKHETVDSSGIRAELAKKLGAEYLGRRIYRNLQGDGEWSKTEQSGSKGSVLEKKSGHRDCPCAQQENRGLSDTALPPFR